MTDEEWLAIITEDAETNYYQVNSGKFMICFFFASWAYIGLICVMGIGVCISQCCKKKKV